VHSLLRVTRRSGGAIQRRYLSFVAHPDSFSTFRAAASLLIFGLSKTRFIGLSDVHNFGFGHFSHSLIPKSAFPGLAFKA
jgi:hypothetical protein